MKSFAPYRGREIHISSGEAQARVRNYRGDDLSPHLRETLLAIAAYYPDPFPELKTLAADLGITERAVGKRIRRLEDLHFLETQYSGKDEGRIAHRFILLKGFPPPTILFQLDQRTCGNCERSISHKRAGARFCSEACKKAAKRALRPKPTGTTKGTLVAV